MNTNNITKLAIALGFVMLSQSAFASCDSCKVVTRQEADQTRSAITSKITESTDTVVSTIQNAIGSATNMITKNASAIAQQQGNDRAAVSKAQTQEQTAIDAYRSVGSMQCGVTSTASSKPAVGNDKRDYDASRLPPALKHALDAAGQTSTPTAPPASPAVQQANLGVGACQAFAGTSTVRAQQCRAAGITPVDANPYVNADIDAATLFDGPQQPGNPSPMYSVPLSGQARDARNTYLSMLDDPTPPATPNSAAAATPQYRAYLGVWTHYEALMSLAARPAQEYDRWTTVDPQTADALQVMSQDPATATYLNTYFANHPNSSMSAGVSQEELMNIEVERRVGNPDWIKEMAAAEGTPLQKQMLMMTAYGLRVQFERLRTEKEIAVLLGQVLATNTNATLRKQVEALAAQTQNVGTNRIVTAR